MRSPVDEKTFGTPQSAGNRRQTWYQWRTSYLAN